MDSTLDAITVRYPRVWQEEGDESAGLPDDPWWADAWTGDDAPTDGAGGYPSAVRALDRIAMMRPEYRAALHAAPVVPVRVVEYVPPTEAELATAQVPQSVPFPAMIGGPVVASCLGLALVFALALVAGMGGMWWLTGGAS